ncbi:MAG TPA: ATP-binding protein [Acidimicrobiia bacterium]|nr:ATP-binding protein [Acidimicrobiia bacterium]
MGNDSLLASLMAAVEARPDDVALRVHLARMLLLKGRTTEAAEHARAALSAGPSDADAKELLRDVEEALVDETPVSEPIAGRGEHERDSTGPQGSDTIASRRGPVTLADVAGLEVVKARLETEFLAPARNPELAARYGKAATGGLLLYGPPGCGKTYIARALAGELGAGFFPVSSATVVSAFPGESARYLAEIFDEARRNTPVMLFFDEVDAIAFKREQMSSAAWLRSLVNQFLSELDGFSSNSGVFVVGATNAPWDVDPAMLRPGRFDRTVAVLPPDEPARIAIFGSHVRGRPVADLDMRRLAKLTDGFSGADIAHVVEEASSQAFTRAMKSGREEPADMSMMEGAIKDVRPSVKSWLEQAKNHVLFSNRDGMLDDLATYMRTRRML